MARRWPRLALFRSIDEVEPGTWVLFPLARQTRLACGFVGILDYRPALEPTPVPDDDTLRRIVDECLERDVDAVAAGRIEPERFAGGDGRLVGLWEMTEALKERPSMVRLATDPSHRKALRRTTDRLAKFAAGQERKVADRRLGSAALECINASLVRMRDVVWALDREVLGAVDATLELGRAGDGRGLEPDRAWELVKLNSILENLDRLEVRGRDSAGISVLLSYAGAGALGRFADGLDDERRADFERRQQLPDLVDGSVVVGTGPLNASLSFVYKVAAEVGKLGDNVRALRGAIAEDRLLQAALASDFERATGLAHTRWASNGIINVANAHPLDQRVDGGSKREGTIQVVLNGDIDNYAELRAELESEGRRIPDAITTDAKIIACWIERHLRQGCDLTEAFRRSVAEFRGSAAIAMHSDLAPGKVFLSAKGSGQAAYVGLARDRLVFASEVYGLVSETSRYFRLDGETFHEPGEPASQGHIVVLDASRPGGVAGVESRSAAGGRVALTEASVRTAQITTRDIDRGGFDHFFLKEISEGPRSVRETLRGKFVVDGSRGERTVEFDLGPEILPDRIVRALGDRTIRHIHMIGQGTASIAAAGIAYLLRRSLAGSGIGVDGFKASELSGFYLRPDMKDTLVVAVTQSGTTTDTNRTIDMVKARGGATLAIVNRRGSDVTDKVDGVFYTSDGRDVEMSVASTKAFYCQVVAGAVLSARLAQVTGTIAAADLAAELEDLSTLPARMEEVLGRVESIAATARALAPTRRHWAVVGSGPNHIAAQEVRIKLSELCYRSIACDFVEDKKHIDLSAEPLILTLAAGNPESVLGDLVKDVAIFAAHKAAPIVVCADGEERFAPYSDHVIRIPRASETVSLILNTVVGHLWGYHAALAINAEGEFFKEVRAAVVDAVSGPSPTIDGHEFQGRMVDFYREFQRRKGAGRLQSEMAGDVFSNLTLLFKYAARQLPLDHFEMEFGRPPARLEVVAELLDNLNRAIEDQGRPIDAIKHQAKTVTVGTSRIEAFPAGILFDALAGAGVGTGEVSYRDQTMLARLQPAAAEVAGLTLYRVENLDSMGDPTAESILTVERKEGIARGMTSRADQGAPLAGTKRSIVHHKEAFLGIGSGDDRRILILPLYDERFRVARLALLHVTFVENLTLEHKVRVLGIGYEDLRDAVAERNVAWTDEFLIPLSPEFLLTETVGAIAERVVQNASEAV